jgi:hypothetical protein
MLSRQALLLAAAVCTLTALPAFAQGRGPGGGGPPGLGGGGPPGLGGGGPPGHGSGGGGSIGTPGPIAGAGLPFLLLAGGYALVRRYRNRNRAE